MISYADASEANIHPFDKLQNTTLIKIQKQYSSE